MSDSDKTTSVITYREMRLYAERVERLAARAALAELALDLLIDDAAERGALSTLLAKVRAEKRALRERMIEAGFEAAMSAEAAE
jgi:hypothetical protein